MKWSEIAPEGTAAWCDEWRDRYRTMDFAGHQADTDAILEAHPNQKSFDAKALDTCIKWIASSGLKVIEFGGWRGGFANHALTEHPSIESWINIEISSLASQESECTDPRYSLLIPDGFIWDKPRFSECNLFVSSHAIEHITKEHLQKLFDWIPSSTEFLFLQAPLPEDCVDNKWRGYGGTHILEIGWNQVKAMLTDKYMQVWRGGHVAESLGECILFRKVS